jgi:hypothetical protein
MLALGVSAAAWEFAAVFLATSAQATPTASARVSGDTPLEVLVNGCVRWLEVATQPPFDRILLHDGPTALG